MKKKTEKLTVAQRKLISAAELRAHALCTRYYRENQKGQCPGCTLGDDIDARRFGKIRKAMKATAK